MDESLYMLWFSLVKDISLKNKLLILKLFKNAKNIYNAKEYDFERHGFYDKKVISTIISSKSIDDVLCYKSMLDKKGVSFVHINEEDYPYLLKNIFDPPILLYYIGRLPKDEYLVAIVGTRMSNSYGESVTSYISKNLAARNIGVVSGLAYGIDTIAHRSALDNNGYTIAVVGCGLDICYPASNQNLMEEIKKKGLIISEYPLGMKAMPHHFPMRNRIVAGLSEATIVTQAPKNSGAIITANLALSEGREVLTVPADIFNKKCTGNNELIKDGAGVITSIEDILFAIDYNIEIEEVVETKNYDNLSDEEKKLLSFVGFEGDTAQELSYKSGFSIEKTLMIITMLEINDIIKKLPNQKFIKI